MSEGVARLNTGNEFISIPDISTATAGIERIGFVHDAFRGCVELHGCEESPLLKPTVMIDGDELFEEAENEPVAYWIPRFTASSPRVGAQATIFAPLERRGFVCVLSLRNKSEDEIKFKAGWRGCWESTYHAAYLSRAMWGAKHANISSWADGVPVIEFRGHIPLFAMAMMPGEPTPARVWDAAGQTEVTEWTAENIRVHGGSPVHYELVDEYVLQPGESRELAVYVGIGLEEVSAVASARELRLQGWEGALANLTSWLGKHTIECGDAHLKRVINQNSFYCYFFSQGIALDSEEMVVTAARSSAGESCATYRDRDAMRWALPAILQIDWPQARKILIHAFTVQLRNVGTRSRSIRGTVLEPGLQLDGLCAPIRALHDYVRVSDDMSMLFDRRVQLGINTIQQILAAQRHPDVPLFETLLLPSGEPSKYPYVCYSNMIVWRSLLDLAWLYNRIRDVDRADEAAKLAHQVKDAILERFVVNGPAGKMFALAVDLKGGFELGDDPAGSVQMMTYLDFCAPNDPVYKNTVEGRGSRVKGRESQVSLISLVNDLLSGRRQEALDFLKRAPLDDGMACAVIDQETGEAVEGRGLAGYAGYLAFGLTHATGAVCPRGATASREQSPSETLYQPPPQANLDTRKARL